MEMSHIKNPDYTDIEQWTPMVFRYKLIPNYFVSSWGRIKGPKGKLLNRRPYPALPICYKNIQNNKEELYKWLKSKGVNLFVSSKDSYVHTDVPRKFLLGGGK